MSIARSILERKLDRQAANKRSADGVPQPNFEAAMDEALRRVILGKNSTDGENAEHRGIPERAGHVPVLVHHFEVGVLKRAVGANVGQRDDIQSAEMDTRMKQITQRIGVRKAISSPLGTQAGELWR